MWEAQAQYIEIVVLHIAHANLIANKYCAHELKPISRIQFGRYAANSIMSDDVSNASKYNWLVVAAVIW